MQGVAGRKAPMQRAPFGPEEPGMEIGGNGGKRRAANGARAADALKGKPQTGGCERELLRHAFRFAIL